MTSGEGEPETSSSSDADQLNTGAVIVHHHLFKNGGSTIDYVLRREFHDSFAELHGSDANSILTSSDLRDFLQANPSVRAVSSHHLRYPTLRDAERDVVDICMLRHPVDRLLSVYRYLRNLHSATDDPLCEAAREMDAPRFFSYALQNFPNWVRNVQVGYLSCPKGSEGDLESALAELPRIALLGTLDLFDESLITWEYDLYPLFPGISLHYLSQNMTASTASTLDQRLERCRQLCGPDLFEELTNANLAGIELFQAASALVKERFKMRADSDHWLHEFRERNRRLEKTCRTSWRARLRNRLFNRDSPDLKFSKPNRGR
jgi:hypothetical protein